MSSAGQKGPEPVAASAFPWPMRVMAFVWCAFQGRLRPNALAKPFPLAPRINGPFHPLASSKLSHTSPLPAIMGLKALKPWCVSATVAGFSASGLRQYVACRKGSLHETRMLPCPLAGEWSFLPESPAAEPFSPGCHSRSGSHLRGSPEERM